MRETGVSENFGNPDLNIKMRIINTEIVDQSTEM